VLLRNFKRPVQSVALSPDYKNDKTYLSGGLAGQLILTTGGRVGVSSDANTTSAAAAASGWLGSIGLGSNTGVDRVLHSGEGSISTIKWSLSGKYVLWVNEQGIKIMRTNFKLDSADADSAWKRIGHIDRPSRRSWEDMAGVWKARCDWINNDQLESDDDDTSMLIEPRTQITRDKEKASTTPNKPKKLKVEKVVVGWGDTAWVLNIRPETIGTGKQAGERIAGSADIAHK